MLRYALGGIALIFLSLGSTLPTPTRADDPPKTLTPPRALTPNQAREAIVLSEGLQVQLVASEPNLSSPVAMTFAPDGKLWVMEMRDYPNGPGPGAPPGGRIRILEDKNGDGVFESSHFFAENILFGNGLLLWKDGVIVTAAPSISWTRDTNGDGKADKTEILYEGFAAENPQLRVSHPVLGLDGWIYVANGLRGGSVVRHGDKNARPISLSGMDFKFNPLDLSQYEAISGMGQFGNTFDDFGNRFVCDNRHHLRHIVLDSKYLKRNPYLAAPGVVEDISILDGGPLSSGGKVYPLSKNWTTSSLHAGRFTAACGIHIYRGDLLPTQYRGAALTCDPTGNLVHAESMKLTGGSLAATPLFDKKEFLASPSDWFRPVSLNIGPQGALYVVDMNRAVIEHPQFMPTELKNRPDLLLGRETGRIWRIAPPGFKATRPRINLAKASIAEKVNALTNDNAWWRQTAQRLLLESSLPAAKVVPELHKALARPLSAEAKIQVAWMLHHYERAKDAELVKTLLQDKSPRVREQGVIMLEQLLPANAQLGKLLLPLANDPDARVRYQVALTLGEWNDPAALDALARIALAGSEKWTRVAVASSVGNKAEALLERMLATPSKLTDAEHATFVRDLCLMIGARRDEKEVDRALGQIAAANDFWQSSWPLAGLNGLADGLARRGTRLDDVIEKLPARKAFFSKLLDDAASKAADASLDVELRLAAIQLLAHAPWSRLQTITPLLTRDPHQDIRVAVVRALASHRDSSLPKTLMQGWRSYTPAVRRAVTEAMLSTGPRIDYLLDEIEARRVKPGDLDALRVRQLVNNRNVKTRQRAQKLLAAAIPGDRKAALAKYQASFKLKGDADRGRLVFKKNCAVCHKVGGLGIDVGPDIADTRTKTPQYLLEAILNPNQAIDNNFINYVVVTSSGKSLTGILQAETASSITLKRAEGQTDVVLRNDIDEILSTGVSLMPEGLEKNITIAEMADLIAFLKNWRYLDGTVPFRKGD